MAVLMEQREDPAGVAVVRSDDDQRDQVIACQGNAPAICSWDVLAEHNDATLLQERSPAPQRLGARAPSTLHLHGPPEAFTLAISNRLRIVVLGRGLVERHRKKLAVVFQEFREQPLHKSSLA